MEGNYEILLGDRPVGEVQVERRGLYYRFSGRCRLSGEVMHRLLMRRGNTETDLGICVPMDGVFGTEKQIAVRQCGHGSPAFFLRAQWDELKGKFVPLSPEEPFRYLHRLENAFLIRQNGQLGIVIKEM